MFLDLSLPLPLPQKSIKPTFRTRKRKETHQQSRLAPQPVSRSSEQWVLDELPWIRCCLQGACLRETEGISSPPGFVCWFKLTSHVGGDYQISIISRRDTGLGGTLHCSVSFIVLGHFLMTWTPSFLALRKMDIL